MPTQDESRTVEAVQTTLDIIEFLLERDGAGITEIADELDRSKGTIHGHMSTLYKNEYVIKKDETYRLSLRHLELGETVRDRLQIYDVVTEELDDLSASCGELAQFAMPEHGQAVYIYKSAGENAVQSASSPGKREYMHCLSLGKAMLAHMSARASMRSLIATAFRSILKTQLRLGRLSSMNSKRSASVGTPSIGKRKSRGSAVSLHR
ncbi:IclR family transcriptional regulator [Haloarcula sp. CBA1131]|uniref:IclR family transcriptional regulator n=1 Tax=Haloarcula sp. CBA1131 TaxID=1853686 RepID=UPI001CD9430B|nr:helix-turn-helix domain-containing protein [Haloarcula sp. CBA1131]